MIEQYDLIIVGAGVAGLSLAVALQNSTFNIAVIEARAFEKKSAPDHVRVSAYNLRSKQFFSELGVWARLPEDALSSFQKVNVWDDSGDGDIHFDCVDIAQSALGYILPNQLIVEQLLARVAELENVKLFCPAKARTVKLHDDRVELNLSDTTLVASLIVGADGANSWLRNHLNMPMEQGSYQSQALITTVKTQENHGKTARQVFLPTGPLAFLPLRDEHQCSIVWSTTDSEAQRLSALAKNDFCRELSNAFNCKLGVVEQLLDLPQTFPLTMRHVKEYVGHRVALIGDAAHTLHPLAGQGINLGLQDAKVLAQTLLTTNQQHRDIGLKQNLRPYERARKGDNQLMISAMQGFKTLFGSDQPAVTFLRNKGLNLTNTSNFLKRQFMHLST